MKELRKEWIPLSRIRNRCLFPAGSGFSRRSDSHPDGDPPVWKLFFVIKKYMMIVLRIIQNISSPGCHYNINGLRIVQEMTVKLAHFYLRFRRFFTCDFEDFLARSRSAAPICCDIGAEFASRVSFYKSKLCYIVVVYHVKIVAKYIN